jgi:hypothetical protein
MKMDAAALLEMLVKSRTLTSNCTQHAAEIHAAVKQVSLNYAFIPEHRQPLHS